MNIKIPLLLLTTMTSIFSAVVVLPGNNTITAAIADFAGEDLILLEGEYTIDSTVPDPGPIDITFPITIQGAGATTIVKTTDTTISSLFLINSSGVTLKDFTARQDFAPSISVDTVISIPTSDLSNIVIDNIKIQYQETGITSKQSAVSITNCFFDYINPITANDARPIILRGNNGATLIDNNTFNSNYDVGAEDGTIFCYASSLAGTSFSGSISITNNKPLDGEGPIKQFFSMDNFDGPLGGLTLIGDGNEFDAVKGSFIFYSGVDLPANLFSSVRMTRNIDNSDLPTTYKGLVGFDGSGSGWDVATDPQSIFSFSGNELTTNSITKPDWVAVTFGGLFGIDTDVYNSFFIVPPVAPPFLEPTSQFKQFEERFSTQGDLIYVLSWENPDPDALSFNIYKGTTTNLIANIPAETGLNAFFDHQQVPGATGIYYIQTVDPEGVSTLTEFTGPN